MKKIVYFLAILAAASTAAVAKDLKQDKKAPAATAVEGPVLPTEVPMPPAPPWPTDTSPPVVSPGPHLSGK